MRTYAIVTAAYWGFTLTDGALRMLVLLHFFRLGFSPFTLALLFVLYEAAGIVANLAGGWLAVRFGISRMLAAGLGLQVAAFLFLAALDPGWGLALSVVWAVAGQGLAGIAKDITKTASKSAIKLTAAAVHNGGAVLFHWVAWFTGSKNAMKGAGFFLGGLLLEVLGFRGALLAMAAGLGVVFVGAVLALPPLFGRAKPSRSARELFAKNRGVNLLAAARIALFGARDVWFVVGLPLFLYGQGWSFAGVGLFLALWTIGYGAVQAATPGFVRRSADGLSSEVPAARGWAVALAAVPAALAAVLAAPLEVRPDLVVVVGLAVFGLAFAVNSSLHSYLILAYAGSEKAAEDVGFYYAANAAGRLLGTLASGALTAAGGLSACLAGSAALLVIAAAVAFAFPTRLPARAAPAA
ncbi:organoarsenical effux MFS transporter ArsJ [Elioraea tepida]|jgi:predicted MFS family arabinose efflux permease|uniref:Organoarsenical effux MFS transporter ArsJ n=1 Tax=Elioraea tepida TaxID=2843330 RepID=A0A975U1P3_9PROT|nr:organoarsenical effux MFS transporter ArsJ [Elioraea tepida]QXM24766.1 organoarsenical effux MFS transporter ArsJ [Elioraea tepida]